MALSLAQRVLQGAARRSRLPLVDGDDVVLTGGALVRAVEERAAALRTAGLLPNDVCVVASRRGTAFWVDLVAVWTTGAVPVPLDRQMHDTELRQILELVRPRMVLGREVPDAEAATLAERALPVSERSGAERTAALLLTSGSTGGAKAVELSERALLGNVDATCAVLPILPATRLAMGIPFHFTSAICNFLATVTREATLVATERPLPARDLAEYVVTHAADAFGGAPLQVRWLAQCADRLGDRLRWVMSSGDHLSPVVVREVRAELPRCDVYTVYGLTEVGGRLCILPASEIDSHLGSVGRPIDGMSVTIRDDQGRPLPDGETGELYAEGPYLARGYYGSPDATRASFSAAGFRTGDVGYRAADGALWVGGRTDDVFKVAGQKVSTGVIEAALRTLGFPDVAVLAIEDPQIGRVAHAFVVPAPGVVMDDGATLTALRRLVPPTHLPRRLHAVRTIPRTGSGKVDRRALRALMPSTA